MDAPYHAYWGKADLDGRFHLLPYHALDVAACGRVLLIRHPAHCSQLRRVLGLDQDILIALATFMLAMHDCGKFSYRFQCLKPDFPGLGANLPERRRYSIRHDTLGLVLWNGVLEDIVVGRMIAARSERSSARALRTALGIWISTSVGHHGQPPAQGQIPWKDHFLREDTAAASLFCEHAGALFLAHAPVVVDDPKALVRFLKPASWWLAGIAVLCDWLGSNAELFAYHQDPIPLETYWHDHALPAAERALAQSGVLPLPASAKSQQVLFPYLKPPSPLQQVCAELALSNTPQLLILEDLTGSGKTEASLTLAHRIQSSGAADGFYLALPTMATSNAMHARMTGGGLDRRLFDGDPCVILTHAASRLVRALAKRESVLPETPPESDYAVTEASAASFRAAWLGDHRKKALLADLGVGTIDQALLAVLPCRHQSLRLLGLARKVLIVDEVHAYDSYMQELLAALLGFQAFIGGHVILLSATLPRATRQSLADAFRAGLSAPPATLAESAYPLLTRVDAAGVTEIPVEARDQAERNIAVACVEDIATLMQLLLGTHQGGSCACWVRNTVDDAISAWRSLRDLGVPADSLLLFHARFALGDRLAIERQVLDSFGPDSGPDQRRGRILIATQVVEQSLDLDFDIMVSDLAPVDLLIQRAGRLQRHARDCFGRRSHKEQRPPPCLHLLSPAATDDADETWLNDLLPGSARVYRDLGVLWRTARILGELGAIQLPTAARTLIEKVYGDELLAIPPGIEAGSLDALSDQLVNASMGRFNTLKLEQGYADPGMDYWEDIVAPTRLGEATIRLRLARWCDGKLSPWSSEDGTDWTDWLAVAMSEVSVRQFWVSDAEEPLQPALGEAIKDALEDIYDKGRWGKLLPLHWVDEGVWEAAAVDGQGRSVRFRYTQETGLVKVQDQ